MNRLKTFNLIFLLLIFSSVLSAQQKITLTSDEAVQRALKSHIDIQRSEISREQARREYKNSWNKVLPSVSADGSVSEKKYWNDLDSDKVDASLSFSANLSVDTGLAASVKALRSSYEAGDISYEETVLKTENSVRDEFYRLLYLREKYENSKKTLETYEKQYEQIKNKYAKGTVTQLDLLGAQVNVETAKPDVDSAKKTFSNALWEFLDTIGIERGAEVELSGSLDDAENISKIEKSILENCEENSFSVKLLEKNLETAKYTKKSTFSSLCLPTLKLGAEVSPELYSYNKDTESGTNTPNWNISAGISIPLDSWIPGSSASVKVSALDDSIKDYELQLENLKKTVRTSAVEKFESIELSQKNIAARKMNVELAQKTYEMTEEAYSRGAKDLLSLQDSLEKLSTAKLQLREEQYSLLSNVLSLETLLSLPSETFLKK